LATPIVDVVMLDKAHSLSLTPPQGRASYSRNLGLLLGLEGSSD
jgi:hypothetical protein